MRYVDIDEVELPTGWLDSAQQATNRVANGADPDDDAAVWRALKHNLADLLYDKCWYCESKIERSDNAVDHFRPKNRVGNTAPAHNGYRWLAFDYRNYRYACTFCNSRRRGIDNNTVGGKADLFPLLNERDRVYTQGPLQQEHPTLLDPCALDDWELLGCQQENGKPCASSSDSIKRHRAETTIGICHLHYEPTCNFRHRFAVQLLSDVDQAKRLFLRAQNDLDAQHEFQHTAKKIKRTINRKSPFSGEMIFLLRGQRHTDHPWVQQLLEI